MRYMIALLLAALVPGAAAVEVSGEAALALKEGRYGCIRGDCENGQGILVERTEKGRMVYRGGFKDGEFHGSGRLVYVDEHSGYNGQWNMGKREGRGTQWKRVEPVNNAYDVYIGQWKNNRRNGQGSQFYKVENWDENKYGVQWMRENTENYTGEFQNDVYNGHGTYHWPNGVKYVGEWAANMKHGEGYFDYGNGMISRRKYEFGERVFIF